MTSTAKSISGWCLKKPIVTTDYVLEGLAARKSIRDPMPKEEDYTPQGGDGVVTTDAAKAEEKGNGPFGGRRDPLKGFVVISLAAGETEGLVMAAGGTIYRAYQLEDDVFNAGTWLDELEAAEKAPIPPIPSGSSARAGGTVVLIETTSRKVKKRRDFLRKRNIRGIAQKNYAMAINQMRGVLVDVDGNEAIGREDVPSSSFRIGWGKAGGAEEQQVQATAKEDLPQESEAARLSTIQEVSREDVSRDETSEKPPSADSKKLPPVEEPPVPAPAPAPEVVPDDKEPEEAREEEGPTTRGKRKRGGGADAAASKGADDAEEAEEPKAAKRTEKSRSTKAAEEPADDEIVTADDDEPAPVEEESSRSKRKRDEEDGAARPKRKRGGGKAATKEEDENEERIVAPTANPNDHRKPLPKKKNGWLGIAPKDTNERAKYKSTKADLDEMDAVYPSEAAITVKKKGLVVRSNEEYRERQAQMRAARGSGPRIVTGRDGKPVKDFKRFRKNVVIRNAGGGVKFRSVLPRESERQRQLEQMERDLEKSQREAEALFNGDDGGGIRNYFGSKSTAKKKKGSRSRR